MTDLDTIHDRILEALGHLEAGLSGSGVHLETVSTCVGLLTEASDSLREHIENQED